MENELQKIREGVLALTDKKLIPLPSTDESKAFYYKMKSDRDRTLQRAAEQIPNVPVPETVSRDGVQQRTVEQTVDAPFPQAVEKLPEVFKVFSQDRVQQRSVEQDIETPAISLVEKIVEMPVTQKTQQLVNTHVQHVVDTVEVEKPKIIELTVQRKKPIIQEKIKENKSIEFPQAQFLDKAGDMPFINKVVDIPVVAQKQVPQVHVVKKTVEDPQFEIVQITVENTENVPQVQVSEETVEISQLQAVEKIVETRETQMIQSTQTSEKLGTAPVCQSTQAEIAEAVEIEVPIPAESASLMSVQRVQKTVEVPQIQFIDKLVDSHVNMRSVPEVEHVVPTPVTADVSAGVKSDITWTKELAEIRQMVEFLVRRERKLDAKTDVAVRRLERLEREQDEQDDHDREASMTEALTDKTKVVKLVVDK